METENIDWNQRIVEILGKGNKTRWVPFGRATKKELWQYLTRRKTFKNDDPYCPYVWLSVRGTPITSNGVKLVIRGLMKKTGIKVHPHKLRHSMAFAFTKGGGDIRHLQEILGHEDLATTAIYLQPDVESIRQQHDRFGPGEKI